MKHTIIVLDYRDGQVKYFNVHVGPNEDLDEAVESADFYHSDMSWMELS